MNIVSGAPSNTEILYELGLEDSIVGTTSLCNYPPDAVEKPSVGGWSQGLNYSKIDELEPDVILLSDPLQNEQALKLDKKDFEVFQVCPGSLEEVFESILDIGQKFDKESEALDLVSDMKKEIKKFDLRHKRIYCEEWMDPPMVSGNWIPHLIRNANGKYFIDEGRSQEFKLSKLKDFNPEFIFLNVCGAGKNIDTSKIYSRDDWQSVKAVKNRNVYVIDDALLNRPGPRLVKGLEKIDSLISKANKNLV